MTDDEPITTEEWLALHLIRAGKESSRALPMEMYLDPQRRNMDEYAKTKDIERILFRELDNWIRWGKKRDWLPVSFRCPLGFLYKSVDKDYEAPPERLPDPIDSLAAVKMERLVMGLPARHRTAFVMYQLGKAAVDGEIRIVKGRDDAARLIGVQKSQYHDIVRQAGNMVLRGWNTTTD